MTRDHSKRALRLASIVHNDFRKQRLALALYRDPNDADGDPCYRWYERRTNTPTDVHASTPASAIERACRAWGGFVWDFRLR